VIDLNVSNLMRGKRIQEFLDNAANVMISNPNDASVYIEKFFSQFRTSIICPIFLLGGNTEKIGPDVHMSLGPHGVTIKLVDLVFRSEIYPCAVSNGFRSTCHP
jgi:hypothetical protein